jgi:hypothetical protein
MDNTSYELRKIAQELEASRQRPETLRTDIDLQLARVESHEKQIKETMGDIETLKVEIGKLNERVKAQRQEEKKLYLLPLMAIILFVAFLVCRGWAEKPSVSITFNVGEIIGGSLVGLGALIAGVTYAYRRTLGGGE